MSCCSRATLDLYGTDGDYVGVTAFDDPLPTKDDPDTNASWNVRGPHNGSDIPPGEDFPIGEFFQIVPAEVDGADGLIFTPLLKFNADPIDIGGPYPVHVHPYGAAVAPPSHTDGPLTHDAQCGGTPTVLRSATIPNTVVDKKHGDIDVPNNSHVAIDADLNGDIYACAIDGNSYVIVVQLLPVEPPNALNTPWETAFYSNGTLPQTLTDAGGWYQRAPNKPNETFELLPRLILTEPGGLPDDYVIAQGEPFVFTVCQSFGGNCL
jgi:hypothetical protein